MARAAPPIMDEPVSWVYEGEGAEGDPLADSMLCRFPALVGDDVFGEGVAHAQRANLDLDIVFADGTRRWRTPGHVFLLDGNEALEPLGADELPVADTSPAASSSSSTAQDVPPAQHGREPSVVISDSEPELPDLIAENVADGPHAAVEGETPAEPVDADRPQMEPELDQRATGQPAQRGPEEGNPESNYEAFLETLQSEAETWGFNAETTDLFVFKGVVRAHVPLPLPAHAPCAQQEDCCVLHLCCISVAYLWYAERATLTRAPRWPVCPQPCIKVLQINGHAGQEEQRIAQGDCVREISTGMFFRIAFIIKPVDGLILDKRSRSIECNDAGVTLRAAAHSSIFGYKGAASFTGLACEVLVVGWNPILTTKQCLVAIPANLMCLDSGTLAFNVAAEDAATALGHNEKACTHLFLLCVPLRASARMRCVLSPPPPLSG